MSDTDDLRADLDAWLDIPIPTGPDPDDPDTEIVLPAATDDLANRILYKCRRLGVERSRVQALYDEEKSRLDSWLHDRMSGIDRDLAAANRSLEGFTRSWHMLNPRSKTLSLPNGKLKLGAVKGKIEVTDAHALVVWAEANGRTDLLRYEPVPAKAILSDEEQVVRHTGPQVTDPKTGELMQQYRLLVPVLTGEVDPETQAPVVEQVSVPGAMFVRPAHDRFKAVLAEDGTPDDDEAEEAGA
jgi:hypothetical protein